MRGSTGEVRDILRSINTSEKGWSIFEYVYFLATMCALGKNAPEMESSRCFGIVLPSNGTQICFYDWYKLIMDNFRMPALEYFCRGYSFSSVEYNTLYCFSTNHKSHADREPLFLNREVLKQLVMEGTFDHFNPTNFALFLKPHCSCEQTNA